jgi:hypothetical protein
VLDLSHRGDRYINAAEYFCSDCSRGESTGVRGGGDDATPAAAEAEPTAANGPSGSFGYCAICYHPLDRCSHCDNEQAESFNTPEEAHDTETFHQLIDDHSHALEFLRELTAKRCPAECGLCLICRADKWLHTEDK